MAAFIGTCSNDALLGGIEGDSFGASAGNDCIDGGSGFDFLGYAPLSAPVAFTMLGLSALTGAVAKGASGVLGFDSFTDIEGLNGGSGNDSFNGSNSTTNVLSYANSPVGVVVNLGLATAQDGWVAPTHWPMSAPSWLPTTMTA